MLASMHVGILIDYNIIILITTKFIKHSHFIKKDESVQYFPGQHYLFSGHTGEETQMSEDKDLLLTHELVNHRVCL